MEDRTQDAGSGRPSIRIGTTIALVVALALTGVPAVAPTVAADHFDCLLHGEGEDCTEPLMDHFGDECEPVIGTLGCVGHVVDSVEAFFNCLGDTPPNEWFGTCFNDNPLP